MLTYISLFLQGSWIIICYYPAFVPAVGSAKPLVVPPVLAGVPAIFER